MFKYFLSVAEYFFLTRGDVVQHGGEVTVLLDEPEQVRGVVPVDAAAHLVEEEAVIADEVSAGAALLAVLPLVLHHLVVEGVHLGGAPGRAVVRVGRGALLVGLALVGEGEHAVRPRDALALCSGHIRHGDKSYPGPEPRRRGSWCTQQ